MKKVRLFGANIPPDCSYCQNGIFNGGSHVCCVKRTLRNGKCRKFEYNPTLRIPKQRRERQSFSADDFKL